MGQVLWSLSGPKEPSQYLFECLECIDALGFWAEPSWVCQNVLRAVKLLLKEFEFEFPDFLRGL
jgi:hypothetical protein